TSSGASSSWPCGRVYARPFAVTLPSRVVLAAVLMGSLLATAPAPPEPGNILLGRVPTGTGVRGDLRVVTDGHPRPEGGAWNGAPSVVLSRGGGELVVDMKDVKPIAALLLQCDDEDVYTVESSEDGTAWETLCQAPPSVDGPGLRARFATFDPPRAA